MTATVVDPGTVTIPAAEYHQLRTAAESWWRWWADPSCFADAVDREIGARIKQTSHDVCSAPRDNQKARGCSTSRWTWALAGQTTHADLVALRAELGWTYPCGGANRCAVCGAPLGRCRVVVTLPEPLTGAGRAWCESHQPGHETRKWCLQHRPTAVSA